MVSNKFFIYCRNISKVSLICLLFIFVSTSFNILFSQNTHLPYFCTFESSSDVSDWTLNAGNTVKFLNKWYVGAPDGKANGNFLYVSGDVGATAGYQAKDNLIVSYKVFDLQAGMYDLAFDWKALGERKNIAELYVVWYPEAMSTVFPMVSLNFYTDVNALPNWLQSYKIKLNDNDNTLYGRADWTHATSQINCPTAGKYRLAFVWVNKNSEAFPPAACIDNVEFSSAACGLPSNVKAVGNGMNATFTWQGTAPLYDFMCKPHSSTNWITMNNIPQNSVIINRLKNGIYDVKIRAICGADTTIWAFFPITFVYEAQCVDYLDLNAAQCSHGDFDNPYKTPFKKDFGYESDLSSHTIHYVQGEYDIRTGGKLKTIPDGAVASVRLGNWDTGAKAEGIVYDYTVDIKTASIMLLKYAVVLEDPGHNEKDQPRFKLEVLDEKGELIDDLCGAADFKAKQGMDGWEYEKTHKIVWKDWTTVGLNLKEYDGRTLKIRLTTYDCNLGAHFGYAYFTLGCTVGRLEGMNCGETPTNEFIAPKGFYYKWYTVSDTTTISNERILNVDPKDRTTYLVDVIYPTESRCRFTLEASAIPRFPLADMEMKLTPKDCKNYVTFINKSCITNDEGKTDKKVDEIFWNFGDDKIYMDENPLVQYPNEGYKGKGYLVASLSNGMCVDTMFFDIDVPSIGPLDTIIVYNRCAGDTVFAQNDTLTEVGDKSFTYISNVTGCDSVVIARVVDAPTYNIELKDTIVNGQQYVLGTQTITEAGEYTERFNTKYGCDSIVNLKLEVLMKLIVTFNELGEICHDDPTIIIPFSITEGKPSEATFTFSDEAKNIAHFTDMTVEYEGEEKVEIPMPANVIPGVYSVFVELKDKAIGYYSITHILDVRYGTSILAQRWNDVVGVKNSEYNGGFNFNAFQWYDSSGSIEGAENPNLYLSQGLDVTSYYYVSLQRSEDGVKQYSCKFQPELLNANEVDEVTIFLAGSTKSVVSQVPCQVRIWSLTGLLVSHQMLSVGETNIIMPSESGVYLMQIIENNNSVRTTKIIIK